MGQVGRDSRSVLLFFSSLPIFTAVKNRAAFKELKLSYHDGYTYISISDNMVFRNILT